MYALLLLVLWCHGMGLAFGSNNTIPPPSGTKAQHVIRIGTMVSGDDLTSETLAQWAACRLNSNASFLPNISFEVYTMRPNVSDTLQHTLSTLDLINENHINFTIMDIEESQTLTPSVLFSTFQVPTVSLSSVSTFFKEKRAYPYLLRSSISDVYESRAILLLLTTLNITSVAYCYTPDLYSIPTAYDFQQQGNSSGIQVMLFEFPYGIVTDSVKSVRAIVVNTANEVNSTLAFNAMVNFYKVYGPSYLYIFARHTYPFHLKPIFLFISQGSLKMSEDEVVNSSYSFQIEREWLASFPHSSYPSRFVT
jgi:hypothetical protein